MPRLSLLLVLSDEPALMSRHPAAQRRAPPAAPTEGGALRGGGSVAPTCSCPPTSDPPTGETAIREVAPCPPPAAVTCAGARTAAGRVCCT